MCQYARHVRQVPICKICADTRGYGRHFAGHVDVLLTYIDMKKLAKNGAGAQYCQICKISLVYRQSCVHITPYTKIRDHIAITSILHIYNMVRGLSLIHI